MSNALSVDAYQDQRFPYALSSAIKRGTGYQLFLGGSMRFTYFLFFFLIANTSFSRPFTNEEKLSDLRQIVSYVKSQYGPLGFKSKHLKLDVDKLLEQYATLIPGTSNLQFYHLINRFVAEFKDSHFGSSVPTSHTSFLGFLCDRVEGKALIDEIDRRILPTAIFPFEKGDEVVAMGRKNASEVVRELSSHIGMGYEESALRIGTMMLGYRPVMRVPPQFGKVLVSVRRGTSSIVDTVELHWIQLGEPITDDTLATEARFPVRMDYSRISVDDAFQGIPNTERGFRCAGHTRIQIPSGATVLMNETAPFVAYYHPTVKGNVGYLRIPHYYWFSPTGENLNELRFQQYEWAVDELERNTVGLIIDQDHNCGGSVMLVEKMVSLFADKPFLGLEFQFLATWNEYNLFKSWIQGEDRTTLAGMDFLGVLSLLKASWERGEPMTPKTTFRNRRLTPPNAVRYSKPIVVLIDELSGSGGDAFPAMMQGLMRAKLLGRRTMGAGGHVMDLPVLNYSANSVRMTKSLFYRPDGTAVENNGVNPDFQYFPTRNDFIYGYREYQKYYLEKLSSLIP